MYVIVRIGDYEMEALVDTGAEISLISEDEWRLLGMEKGEENKYKNIRGITAARMPLEVIGQITPEVSIGGQELGSVCLRIVRNYVGTAILGVDVIGAKKIKVNLAEDRLEYSSPSGVHHCLDMFANARSVTEAAVTSVEAVTVPAKSITEIRVSHPGAQCAGTVGCNPQMKNQGLMAAAGVYSCANDKWVMNVVNMTSKKIKIRRGEAVGQIFEVSGDEEPPRERCGEFVPQGRKGEFVPTESAEGDEEDRDWETIFELEKSELTDEQRAKVLGVIARHEKVISRTNEDLGCVHSVQHRIRLSDDMPQKQPVRRLHGKMQAEVEGEASQMHREGITEPSDSPWSSPVVPIRKKDGRLRLCIDYRRLNAVTVKDSYPLPNLTDALYTLHGTEFFTSLDLTRGYYQVAMEEESKALTAFSTAKGHWQFRRMPFGLTNAPATFQRLINVATAHLSWEQVLCYIDDVLILGKTFEEHLENFDQVMTALGKYNLKVKTEKCFLFRKEVKFLGHIVSKNGVRPDPINLQGITEYPEPKTVKEVRAFLGLVNFYRRHIPECSTISKPLSAVTGQKKLAWTETCRQAFKELKEKLTKPPVLSYPNYDGKDLELMVDASGIGSGACLMQEQENALKAIAYISMSFSAAQRNYSTVERELSAVRWAVKSLRPFLVGKHFVLRSDHQPLTYLTNMRMMDARIARTLEDLGDFDYTIRYLPGKFNVVADALSRVKWAHDEEKKPGYEDEYKQDPPGYHSKVEGVVPGGGDSLFEVLSMILNDGDRKHAKDLRKEVVTAFLESLPTGEKKPSKDLKRRLKMMQLPGTLVVSEVIQKCAEMYQRNFYIFENGDRPIMYKGTDHDSKPGYIKSLLGVHFNRVFRNDSKTEEAAEVAVETPDERLWSLSDESPEDPGLEIVPMDGVVGANLAVVETRSTKRLPRGRQEDLEKVVVLNPSVVDDGGLESPARPVPNPDGSLAGESPTPSVSGDSSAESSEPESESHPPVRLTGKVPSPPIPQVEPHDKIKMRHISFRGMQEIQGRNRAISRLKDLLANEPQEKVAKLVRTQPVKGLGQYARHLSTLGVERGVLYRQKKTGEGPRVAVLPYEECKKMAGEIHRNLGHLGRTKLEDAMSREGWHPQQYKICASLVRECFECQRYKHPANLAKPPLLRITTKEPFELVALDLMEFSRSREGFVYCLMAIDNYTRFLYAVALKDKTGSSVTKAFFRTILPSMPRQPARIMTDNGKEFDNEKFRAHASKYNIKHTFTTPYRPSSNGLVERVNRTIKNQLGIRVGEGGDWTVALTHAVMTYNATLQSGIGKTPGEQMMGGATRLPLTCDLEEKLGVRKKGGARWRPYALGDEVMRKVPVIPQGVKGKFVPPWEGPYVITKVHKNECTYELARRGEENEKGIRKKRSHYRQLKPYHRGPQDERPASFSGERRDAGEGGAAQDPGERPRPVFMGLGLAPARPEGQERRPEDRIDMSSFPYGMEGTLPKTTRERGVARESAGRSVGPGGFRADEVLSGCLGGPQGGRKASSAFPASRVLTSPAAEPVLGRAVGGAWTSVPETGGGESRGDRPPRAPVDRGPGGGPLARAELQSMARINYHNQKKGAVEGAPRRPPLRENTEMPFPWEEAGDHRGSPVTPTARQRWRSADESPRRSPRFSRWSRSPASQGEGECDRMTLSALAPTGRGEYVTSFGGVPMLCPRTELRGTGARRSDIASPLFIPDTLAFLNSTGGWSGGEDENRDYPRQSSGGGTEQHGLGDWSFSPVQGGRTSSPPGRESPSRMPSASPIARRTRAGLARAALTFEGFEESTPHARALESLRRIVERGVETLFGSPLLGSSREELRNFDSGEENYQAEVRNIATWILASLEEQPASGFSDTRTSLYLAFERPVPLSLARAPETRGPDYDVVDCGVSLCSRWPLCGADRA